MIAIKHTRIMSAPKFSDKEIVLIDDLQKAEDSTKDILSKLQRDRARRGSAGLGNTAVYDFLLGRIHRQLRLGLFCIRLRARGTVDMSMHKAVYRWAN